MPLAPRVDGRCLGFHVRHAHACGHCARHPVHLSRLVADTTAIELRRRPLVSRSVHHLRTCFTDKVGGEGTPCRRPYERMSAARVTIVLKHQVVFPRYPALLPAASLTLRQKVDAVLNDEYCGGDIKALAPFPASRKLSTSCPRILLAHLLMGVRQTERATWSTPLKRDATPSPLMTHPSSISSSRSRCRHHPISKFFMSMTLWIHFAPFGGWRKHLDKFTRADV